MRAEGVDRSPFYQPCPDCQTETFMVSSEPIPEDEAHTRFCAAEFERFYSRDWSERPESLDAQLREIHAADLEALPTQGIDD